MLDRFAVLLAIAGIGGCLAGLLASLVAQTIGITPEQAFTLILVAIVAVLVIATSR